jgi:hypothetical protein
MAEEDDEEDNRLLELEDMFVLHAQPSATYRVKLSSTALTLDLCVSNNRSTSNNPRHQQLIPIDDIYGCSCMKVKQNPLQCHLVLYLYTLQRTKGFTGTLSAKLYRHRSETILTYGKFDDFQLNFAQVTRWYQAIQQIMYIRRQLPGKIRT